MGITFYGRHSTSRRGAGVHRGVEGAFREVLLRNSLERGAPLSVIQMPHARKAGSRGLLLFTASTELKEEPP